MLFQDYYSTSDVREVCHAIKQESDLALRQQAVEDMASYLSSFDFVNEACHLVPAPQHIGYADYTLDVAESVARATGAHVLNIVRCWPHRPVYEQKQEKSLCMDLEFYLVNSCPKGERLFLVDNVISSGETFRRINALFNGALAPLVFAVDYKRLEDPILLSLLNKSQLLTY